MQEVDVLEVDVLEVDVQEVDVQDEDSQPAATLEHETPGQPAGRPRRSIAPLGPSPADLRRSRMRALLAEARAVQAAPKVSRRDLHWLTMFVEDGTSATKVNGRLEEEHFVRTHPATRSPCCVAP